MSEPTIRDVVAKAAQAIRALRQMRDTDKPRKLDEALTWRANDDLAEQLASEALSGLDAAMAAQPDKVACPNCGMDYALAAEMRAWKDDEGAAPPDRQEQPCVCMVDDSLVREWVQKAREVARHKGFQVAAPVPQGERVYTQAELNEACSLAIERTLQNVREGRIEISKGE